jgi:frataxin-like iron-binding protein CyaY
MTSTTWLMATRRALEDEAEPILIEHDGHVATFTLDDGDQIVIDRTELLAALNAASKEAA